MFLSEGHLPGEDFPAALGNQYFIPCSEKFFLGVAGHGAEGAVHLLDEAIIIHFDQSEGHIFDDRRVLFFIGPHGGENVFLLPVHLGRHDVQFARSNSEGLPGLLQLRLQLFKPRGEFLNL